VKPVTKTLLAQHGKTMRYFRHPFLDVGRDLQTRRELEAFPPLRVGYRIDLLTLDRRTRAFAPLYDAPKAPATLLSAANWALISLIRQRVFDYDEKFSRESTLAYELPQIPSSAQSRSRIIWENVSISFATRLPLRDTRIRVNDDAYSLPNTYVGEHGSGWLEQWAVSRGKITQRRGPEISTGKAKTRQALRLSPGNAPARQSLIFRGTCARWLFVVMFCVES